MSSSPYMQFLAPKSNVMNFLVNNKCDVTELETISFWSCHVLVSDQMMENWGELLTVRSIT